MRASERALACLLTTMPACRWQIVQRFYNRCLALWVVMIVVNKYMTAFDHICNWKSVFRMTWCSIICCKLYLAYLLLLVCSFSSPLFVQDMRPETTPACVEASAVSLTGPGVHSCRTWIYVAAAAISFTLCGHLLSYFVPHSVALYSLIKPLLQDHWIIYCFW